MKKMTIILILVLTTALGFGQTNDLPKRDTFTLNIAVDDSSFYNSEIKASAYVLPDNTIQLYPGEKIYVEVELVKKEIKSMKTVKENLNPDKTITITFSQQTDGKKHKGMMLEVENPFNKELEYKANMFLMKYNKWVSTSVLPVQPKLTSFETWTDIIVTIALTGWEFK
jgi:hypothetical protein